MLSGGGVGKKMFVNKTVCQGYVKILWMGVREILPG